MISEIFDKILTGFNYPLAILRVHTTRFLKYVWPFYNNMHERVNDVGKHNGRLFLRFPKLNLQKCQNFL